MAGPECRALCVGLSEFGAPSDTFEDEEPDEAEEDFRERLGFAEPLTRELAKTLEDFGYEAEVHGSQSLPTAEMLGQEVRKATPMADFAGRLPADRGRTPPGPHRTLIVPGCLVGLVGLDVD
jgi:hypothetical protein